jgi:Ion channel
MRDLLIGGAISLVNFGIHAVMTALIVVTTRRMKTRTHHSGIFVRLTALLTITVTILMLAHIVEIAIWAAVIDALGIKIANTGAFEYAFENYTALGYGDALPINNEYRLIGPVMALNGLLLIGWSVAVIFEVMRMVEFEVHRR